MSSINNPAILPEPPDELKQHSAELEQRIATLILQEGPIPFSRYMEMALYEPGLGYYSAGLHKFGEQGDFVTSPELGNVFARCLAAQISQLADTLDDYCVLEVGAGSGRLAADLLGALSEHHVPSRYLILERSADLRKQQQQTIKARRPDLLDRVEWLDQPPVESWQGIVIANELLDALPVECFRLSGDQIQQAMVANGEAGLAWDYHEAGETLEHAVRHTLGERQDSLAEGYSSELSLMMTPWLQGLSSNLEKGCILLVDYGYPRHEYYSAQRSMGTLVCHYRHHAHDDPFRYPGLQDISAFVDFTALAEAADASGLECTGYCNQAMFLIGCGLEEILRELEQLDDHARLERAAEIRRLTLPGEMGEKFQVMALTRDMDIDLRGFSMQDLRHRL